jgi:hypothetical protein
VCARACGFKIKNQSECIIVVIGEVFFETTKFAEFLFLVLAGEWGEQLPILQQRGIKNCNLCVCMCVCFVTPFLSFFLSFLFPPVSL